MKIASKLYDNRGHSINYKRWHKCAKCMVFTLFDDDPEKTMMTCPECWKVWKHLPQYRVTKLIPRSSKKVEKKVDWPIEYMLLYRLVCSLCLLTIAYYLWVN